MQTNSTQLQAEEANSRKLMSFLAEYLKLTYPTAIYKLLNFLSASSQA